MDILLCPQQICNKTLFPSKTLYLFVLVPFCAIKLSTYLYVSTTYLYSVNGIAMMEQTTVCLMICAIAPVKAPQQSLDSCDCSTSALSSQLEYKYEDWQSAWQKASALQRDTAYPEWQPLSTSMYFRQEITFVELFTILAFTKWSSQLTSSTDDANSG